MRITILAGAGMVIGRAGDGIDKLKKDIER
jgi:ribosomal protein S3